MARPDHHGRTTAPPPRVLELANVAVEAMVAADTYAPFCRVTVTTADGTTAIGQLTPGETVILGEAWLATAQAARDDAAIVRALLEGFLEGGADQAAARVSAVGMLDRIRAARQDAELSGELDAAARGEADVRDEEPGK